MRYKYKILHLEDAHSDAELAARELRKSNFRFEHFVVDNEKCYREALETYAPDIILCDHSLAAFNSNEALAIFKEKNINIPFIIITATLTDEVAIGVLKDGADDYILKDRLKRLPSAVMNAIERYRLERERKQLLDETQEKEALSKKNQSDLSNKLLLATKTAGIGIWEYFLPENKFKADDVWLSLYGINSAEFTGSYESWMQYIHPEDKKRVNREFENALVNHIDFDTEFRNVWPDGSVHFIKSVAVVQKDSSGEPTSLVGINQDITKSKEAEKVLRASEFRLVEAQSVAKVGSWETDLSNFKVIWSLETYRIFEIAPKDENTSHQNFLGCVHPEDRDKVDAAFIASLSNQKVNTIEHRIVSPAGSIKTVEERWRIISDDKGQPICARGTIQDISERKQSEQLIIKSEAKYRSFFESSMDGILLTATDGEIISANPAACEIFKMSEDEICATGRLGLADISDPRLQLLLQERELTGRAQGEITLLRKDGSKFSGEVTSSVFLDVNGQERTSMIIRDITERKQAEEKDAFKAKLLNTIGQSVISIDLNGIINYWNKAAEEMYGWTADEAMGKNIAALLPSQQTTEQADEIIQQVLQGNSWEGEFILQRKDGTVFPVYATDSPIYDQYNKLAGIIGISTDITERKKAEQFIQESEAFNRGVLDSMSSHLAVINESGTILKVNKTWDIFAMNNGSPTLDKCGVGTNYFDACTSQSNGNDDIPALAMDGIKKVLDGTLKDFYLEYPCHSPIEERWFYMRVKKFESSQPLALIEHQYITERKKAEEKVIATSNVLQQTLNDMDSIMNSSLDIICTIDEGGKFVKVSAASERILGYKPDELSGRKFMDFVFYEDVEITIAGAARVMSGAPVTIFENRYVHKNGNVVPMLWSARWDDSDKMMYCIAKDATEKKRFEAAFEIERKRFSNMILGAPTAMGILKGTNYIYEMANAFCLELIGKTDVIGKPLAQVMPEVVEQGFIEILNDVYKTGEAFKADEMLLKIDKNGNGEFEDFYLNLLYEAYRNTGGEIEGIFFFAVDVTEQVLSRKKIEDSEKQYRMIVETAQEGIWVIDENNITTFVNKKMTEIMGYSYDEMIGRTNLSFKDEPGRRITLQQIERRKTGVKETHEASFITKSGQSIITQISTNPVFDEDSLYRGALAMVTDITEMKAAEHSLKESEKRFRQIVETAQEGIWLINEHSKTSFVNNKLCEIFQYSPEEMMGKDIYYFMDDEGKEIAEELMRKKKEGEMGQVQHKYISKSGNVIWTNVSANPLFREDGTYEGALAMITDITDRRMIEQKLAHSESTLKEAQAIAYIGNWEIDLVTNTQLWSDELYKILGVDKETVSPSTELYLSLIHPDDVNFVREEMLKSSNALTGSSFEYRLIIRKSVKYCYTQSKFKLDKNNNPLRLYGVVQDISQRKLTEIERTKMVNDLIQRNKELEQFTYIVSHNLRAPVANIMGFAEVLSDKTYPESLKQECLSQLSVSVSKLDDVTRDLNNVLLTKQKVNDVKEEISLSAIVSNVQISIQNLIEEYAVTIETDFTEVETIFSIKTFLHSILYNLISNSIKYRSPDKAPLISIRTHKTPERIELVFSDNGLGIDMKKNHDKVFGLYKRFHLNIEGKGLGLFMTKSQIETLGGSIDVSSEINNGTTFKIYLPVSTIQL